MQNFSETWLRDWVPAGQLRLSAGDGAKAWIDTDDVGAVAARTLLDDRQHRAHLPTVGPRPLTLREIASELTAATGRQIESCRWTPTSTCPRWSASAYLGRRQRRCATCSP